MSQMSKIILKVINERLKKKVEEEVDKVQFGFRKGFGDKKSDNYATDAHRKDNREAKRSVHVFCGLRKVVRHGEA